MDREEEENACFLLLEESKRELVTVGDLRRLIQDEGKLVSKGVVGIQVFDPSSDWTDRLYSVSIQGKGHYEVQVNCWVNREKELLRDKQLELRLVRLAKEVLRQVEQRCKALVVRLELVCIRDCHGGLKLVGTEKAQVRYPNSTLISHSKSLLYSFNLPPNGLSHPLILPRKVSDARPFSGLLRSRFRSRPKIQATPSPESLVVAAVKTCTSTDRMQRSRTTDRVRRAGNVRNVMVDQETQAEGEIARPSLVRQPTRQQRRREMAVSNISMNLPENSWTDSLIQDPFVRLSFHRDRKMSRGGSSSVSLTEPSDADRAKNLKKGLRTGLASRNLHPPPYPA